MPPDRHARQISALIIGVESLKGAKRSGILGVREPPGFELSADENPGTFDTRRHGSSGHWTTRHMKVQRPIGC